mmetsp:Transcript_98854/g.284033  ORF Transcript_98854/g.284033 Transcript_98854/m.284033 type:complete len:233 (-) Transcript_98854:533-1231(-)
MDLGELPVRLGARADGERRCPDERSRLVHGGVEAPVDVLPALPEDLVQVVIRQLVGEHAPSVGGVVHGRRGHRGQRELPASIPDGPGGAGGGELCSATVAVAESRGADGEARHALQRNEQLVRLFVVDAELWHGLGARQGPNERRGLHPAQLFPVELQLRLRRLGPLLEAAAATQVPLLAVLSMDPDARDLLCLRAGDLHARIPREAQRLQGREELHDGQLVDTSDLVRRQV